ncbi:hypothetical protein CMI42_02030 [Candidatus Pacearchaeota archaeon]|nr:hypothetical protein [Candidatus Pacearchaeota archaeon]|tara:strand:+ start:2371 stop:2661 length:291 start_codon:yes stop_codon:yes gene_type:complete
MDYIFEITDKTGREVRLTKERWEHILDHKGMEQRLEDIKKTLVNPTTITHHKHDENRRNYYLYYKEKKRYLLVAVRYLNGEGYVSTSFITRKIIKK